MTALITPHHAQAYVNFGRWVAECPWECGSAKQLEPHEQVFRCTECLMISPLDWPYNADDIWEALAERRAPRNRNWFPDGHPLAIKFHAPTNQTPDELRKEQAECEALITELVEPKE